MDCHCTPAQLAAQEVRPKEQTTLPTNLKVSPPNEYREKL